MKHILCGNPNVGKTTFLNSLTLSNEHVGNWHGVTVDFLEKKYVLNNDENIIVDLPGIYSLSCFSYEEEIARDYIYKNNDNIINLIDSNNLSRNLYLTLQLLELGKNIKLCLNFSNDLHKTKTSIDIKMLSKMLGTNAVLFNAQDKLQTKNIIDDKFKNEFKIPYLNDLPIDEIKNIVKDNFNNLNNINKNYICIKLLEQDEYIINSLKLDENQLKKIRQFNLKEKIVELRYKFIDEVIKKSVKKESSKIYGYNKLDKILLNKFLAFPIFLVVIFIVFYLTFNTLGSFLSENLTNLINNYINAPILKLLNKITASEFIISFFEDAVLTVLTTLASFLPQIVLLFLFLSILEDTGYLSRLAFVFEDIFSKVGLNGRSVFTLLMGFGCNTTAALTARGLDNKNSRIKSTILCSYMSCTAKIPLYSVILGAFFNNNIFIIFFLYFLGVLIALFLSVILEKTILKSGNNSSFIMEMPALRLPKIKRILKLIVFNIKDFLVRVSGTIFIFSIIIWFLQSISINFTFITSTNQTSLLEMIGNFLSPIFAPLGFNSSGCVCALICGVVAKEIIVSTMAIINNVSTLEGTYSLSQSFKDNSSAIHFNPITAFSFLIFSLLYMPCLATISVYFKELGKKWTIFSIIIQFLVAYLVTFIFYRFLLLFNGLNFISILLSLSILVFIIASFTFSFKFIKKPKVICFSCNNCKKCLK